MKNLVIIGAGGFAREIYDLAKICSENETLFKIKGFLSKENTGIESLGYPSIISTLEEYLVEEEDVFICAIGDVNIRKRLTEKILLKGGEFINLIHPNVVISSSVKVGTGIVIKAYCVLASNVIIEDFSILQSAVILGHDVHIGKYCQINSFSFFAGYSKLEDLVFVGAHSKFIQNTIAEEQSIIGIGSLVLKRVKKGTSVFGTPAKRISM